MRRCTAPLHWGFFLGHCARTTYGFVTAKVASTVVVAVLLLYVLRSW